ncbi:energy-coupling factor transport system substrate-specific component [Kineococcus radiotolerans]|uniref:Energy-coupling factor transport system substrate-specific component n=1 Tax=Kineococcus radiotolerans TaxID=131568 RepID=A0A7W4XY36_KINRA|nr:ECF transporter S component [Kineococcus radiotolerans]MBB2902583.1 energy-coupling factor transport system substrate-specific component [Kineococcus radiotolerans]
MSTTLTRSRGAARWRTVDLLTAAVLGVAFGVVFWGWGVVYTALTPVFAAVPFVQSLLSGVWLLPAVVAALVVRRPGAALLAELVAASVEALLGSHWGFSVLISGAIQGFGVELAVALFAWRRFGPPVAVLGGVLAALLEGVYELHAYYAGVWTLPFQVVYVACFVVSGAVVAGLGGWALVRGLARSGALGAFAAGRDHRRG